MAQLSDDAFAFGSELMPVEEARRAMAERVKAVAEMESVPLIEADGRVLATSLIAPIDLPNFDNSAVDGYAVRFASLKQSGETIMPVAGRHRCRPGERRRCGRQRGAYFYRRADAGKFRHCLHAGGLPRA